MLFVKDARTREYLLWNKAGEDTTGLARQDVLGRTDAQLFASAGEDFMKRDEMTMRMMMPQSFESRFTRPDGEDRLLRTRRIAVPGENGNARYLLGISEDVTEWRQAQDRLLFLAGHDPLTHLKNRVSFEERLAARLADGELAVLAIDLDRFKAVTTAMATMSGIACCGALQGFWKGWLRPIRTALPPASPAMNSLCCSPAGCTGSRGAARRRPACRAGRGARPRSVAPARQRQRRNSARAPIMAWTPPS
jgi:PAS domain S-box-containing protein